MIRASIVIPTYNEAKNLPFLIEEILSVIDKTSIDLELIVVDDNSPDGTGVVAEGLARQYPIKVIHRSGKLGLGSAVREGFAISDRQYLGVMDADLSHDPVILNEMIANLDSYAIIIGSRFETESAVENWTVIRQILSKTGVGLARLLTHTKDPLSGYFFFDRKVIRDVPLTTTGYKILLEMLVKCKYSRVKEIPYRFRMRRYSTSKLNFKEMILFFEQLVAYSFYKLFH